MNVKLKWLELLKTLYKVFSVAYMSNDKVSHETFVLVLL